MTGFHFVTVCPEHDWQSKINRVLWALCDNGSEIEQVTHTPRFCPTNGDPRFEELFSIGPFVDVTVICHGDNRVLIPQDVLHHVDVQLLSPTAVRRKVQLSAQEILDMSEDDLTRLIDPSVAKEG